MTIASICGGGREVKGVGGGETAARGRARGCAARAGSGTCADVPEFRRHTHIVSILHSVRGGRLLRPKVLAVKQEAHRVLLQPPLLAEGVENLAEGRGAIGPRVSIGQAHLKAYGLKELKFQNPLEQNGKGGARMQLLWRPRRTGAFGEGPGPAHLLERGAALDLEGELLSRLVHQGGWEQAGAR